MMAGMSMGKKRASVDGVMVCSPVILVAVFSLLLRLCQISLWEKIALFIIPILGACTRMFDMGLLLRQKLDGYTVVFHQWMVYGSLFVVWETSIHFKLRSSNVDVAFSKLLQDMDRVLEGRKPMIRLGANMPARAERVSRRKSDFGRYNTPPGGFSNTISSHNNNNNDEIYDVRSSLLRNHRHFTRLRHQQEVVVASPIRYLFTITTTTTRSTM